MKFTAGVASYAMLITDSPYKGSSHYDDILDWLNAVELPDKYGFKGEFQELVIQSKNLHR